MNKYTCRACNSSTELKRLSDLEIETAYHFSECANCGVFKNDVDLLADGYPTGEVNTDWELLRRDIEKFIPVLNHIEHLRQWEKGRLMDIGCSTGYLVWLARLRGWNALGVDVKMSAAKEAKRLFDVPVHVGEFEDFEWGTIKNDCIVFNHGIEHLRKPKKAIEVALENLSERGIIYMQHPVMPSSPFDVKQVISPGHQYEWSYPAFQTFLKQFPITVINTTCGAYSGGKVPASQTWLITHK